jgi:putative long chain acyl-CoA synthase
MSIVDELLNGPAGRLAQNALEVARFGGLETGEEASPFEVVATRPIYRLRRYFPPSNGRAERSDPRETPRRGSSASDKGGQTPASATGSPVILVPPMMLAAEVYDVSPSSTAVGTLHAQGVDPWVVDFGAPEHEEGGLERTLADHVLAVSDAVDRVRKATGKDPHLGG